MLKTNVEQTLDNFGSNVIRLSKINLGILKKDVSGRLRKTLDYEVDVSKNQTSFSFSILAQPYAWWVDQGRKPGKGIPPHVALAWVKQKPVRLRDLKTGSFVKKTESKVRSVAFLINRKIKEKGIAATNFLTDPFDDKFRELPDELIEAFGLDVDVLIEQALDNGNIPR